MVDADIPTIELGCTLLGAAGQHQLLFMMYTKLLDSINRTAGPYTELQLDSISNGEVLQVVMSGSSFKENSGRLREKYPSIKWDDYPQEVLRVKIKRLRDRITKLRRNKHEEEISIALNSKFEFPTPKPNLNAQNLTAETDHLTHENRALKRQLEAEHDQTENLKIQIEHNERKINLLLESLNIITTKHKSAICQVKDIASLQKESKQWEQKYDEMSKKLDQTLSQLEESKDKLKMLCSRNTNKKLKRRDIKVETLKESLRESECVVEEKEHEIEMNTLACQEKTDDIERLKKDKRNLLVKVCRLNKKSSDEHKSMYEMEIQKLKGEIKQKEHTITELQQINDILDQSEIECFYEGKYSNEIRETIMSLITSGGVSLSKVNEVIQTVVHNITGRTLSRLPSAGVRSRLYSEAKRVAQVQAVQAMIDNDTSTCSVSNITENSDIFSGNCLHQDGTSKFHRHFQSFQVTTADNTTYSLGLSEVGSADASTLMDAFKEQISDLADAVKTNNEHAVSKLVSSIVSTMSDQGATNPVFNRQLSELKQSVLPDIIDNWDSLSASTKMEVSKISNFFCKMHIFINMASETDKCLVTFENNVCTGRNPYSFEWKESGASRLTRTVSKAFTMHGCEKSGVGSHFSTHLENKKVSNKLITFRGHRFNHLFYAAGATYHHLPDIIDFLDNWAGPNDLLKSISFDCREKAYTSGLRALGIIDKLITGPLWRIIEGTQNVLDLNPQLAHLQSKLQQLSQDASPMLSGELIFPDSEIHKDAVYDSLFSVTDDPVTEMYTQMALELCLAGMLLILERQAKDQLPGGTFFHPSLPDKMRGSSVPTTNTCSERDFAQLDVLMRLKPSASTVAYESIIMWSNNKTTQWLNTLSLEEKQVVLDDARKSAPEMMTKFKSRQRALFEKKLSVLRSKKEKKEAQETKQYTQKVKLTGKLNAIGGLWTSENDIMQYSRLVSSESNHETLVKDAIISQLQFRKSVLGSKGPKEKFQQSTKGNNYSLNELQQNLQDIIQINGEEEETSPQVKTTLQYLSPEEIQVNISGAKNTLAAKLAEGRRKITISQQSLMLPSLIDNPQILVGKHILHKFKDPNSGEVTWYSGEVGEIQKMSGRTTKYEVKYDDEDDVCKFPLLIDMEKAMQPNHATGCYGNHGKL